MMDCLACCRIYILVVIYLAAHVNAVNFDGNCIVDANCTERNTTCSNSTNKCECSTTAFRNPTACVPKIAYNATCNIAYAANQCSVQYTVCTLDGTYRCLCDSAYYETVGKCQPRQKPGTGCASGQCVVNAKCTNSTCVCNVGYQATPATNSISCSVQSSGVAMVTVNILLFVLGVITQLYFPSQL